VRSDVTGREKSAENHYPTMPTDDICALWGKIGAPAKRDAVLFLWATNPMLPDALRVMEAWGFAYVHHWIWDKEIAGTGYWGRDRHELLLIGRQGDPASPLPGSQPETVHREAKGRHSVKPGYFAETIERLYPDMPRLEMFCRSPRPGWTAWGHEAGQCYSPNEIFPPDLTQKQIDVQKYRESFFFGDIAVHPGRNSIIQIREILPKFVTSTCAR
jgi:N6-adenosine-specific RNA methylase IME4